MKNYWQETEMEHPDIFIRTQSSFQSMLVMLHSHTFYEILFCRGGNIHYLLDGQRFRLQQGDVLLIPPGLSHQPLFPEPLTECYERYVLWIGAEFWNRCVEKDPLLDFAFQQCKKRGSYVLRSNRPTWNGLFLGVAAILREVEEKRIGWETCMKYSAINLMAHISRIFYYQDIASPTAEKENLIDDIYKYIDSNLSKKIGLEDVAQHFLVSKSTISHLFRKQYQTSFYQCVIHRRLISAKNDILSGVTLNVIWNNCGFSDYSSFFRAFKKEYGISPSQFQKMHKNRQKE